MMKRIKEDDRMTKITMKEIAEFAGVGKRTLHVGNDIVDNFRRYENLTVGK